MNKLKKIRNYLYLKFSVNYRKISRLEQKSLKHNAKIQNNISEITNLLKRVHTNLNLVLYQQNSNENHFVKKESELFKCYELIALPAYEKQFFGQSHEDLIIEYLLPVIYKAKINFKEITYLDVGCNHPISGNNTYKLYKKGARGVLIEPNKKLLSAITKVRKEDTLIPKAVSTSKDNIIKYYVSEKNELNTTNKDFLVQWKNNHKNYAIHCINSIQEVTVPSISINEVLEKNFIDTDIDVISIDIEGNELEIIESIDHLKFHFKIIIIEWNESFNGNKQSISQSLKKYGYILYSDTGINGIYVLSKYLK